MANRFVPIPIANAVLVAPNNDIERRVHGWNVSETGGATDLVVTFWRAVSTQMSSGGRVNPNGTGTDVAAITIRVPKGTTSPTIMDHQGLSWTGGLYMTVSGGTALGSLFFE